MLNKAHHLSDTWKIPEEYIEYSNKIINEILHQIYSQKLAKNKAEVEMLYDKSSLDIIVKYQGQLLEIPSLSHEKVYTLLEDEAVSYGLVHYFKGFYPDQIHLSTTNNDCQISLRFYIQ